MTGAGGRQRADLQGRAQTGALLHNLESNIAVITEHLILV